VSPLRRLLISDHDNIQLGGGASPMYLAKYFFPFLVYYIWVCFCQLKEIKRWITNQNQIKVYLASYIYKGVILNIENKIKSVFRIFIFKSHKMMNACSAVIHFKYLVFSLEFSCFGLGLIEEFALNMKLVGSICLS
jgi:hypothetical protein